MNNDNCKLNIHEKILEKSKIIFSNYNIFKRAQIENTNNTVITDIRLTKFMKPTSYSCVHFVLILRIQVIYK